LYGGGPLCLVLLGISLHLADDRIDKFGWQAPAACVWLPKHQHFLKAADDGFIRIAVTGL
jgi:hypothetical protein